MRNDKYNTCRYSGYREKGNCHWDNEGEKLKPHFPDYKPEKCFEDDLRHLTNIPPEIKRVKKTLKCNCYD